MREPSLKQMRAIVTVVECGLKISPAAERLNIAQSSLSNLIQQLEAQIGIPIFIRSARRLDGLTDFGLEFMLLSRDLLRRSGGIVELAQERLNGSAGILRVGTTHVHACYTLAQAIEAFAVKHADVHLDMPQSDPHEIAEWVSSGRVQFGISTLPDKLPPGLVALPAFKTELCLITPLKHKLLRKKQFILQDIAKCPFICCRESFSSSKQLQEVFRQHGLTLNVRFQVGDATVIKKRVAKRLGVAVIQRAAIEPEDEQKLGVLDASHIFEPAVCQLILRKDQPLRTFAYDFIEEFAPQWTKRAISERISHPGHH